MKSPILPESRKKIVLFNLPGDKLFLRDQYCSFVSKANYLWPPIDLLVQSGILYDHFEIEVLDAIAEKIDETNCLTKLKEIGPDGILFLSGTASWKNDFNFLRRLKKSLPKTLLLGSGGNLFFNHQKILKENRFIDAILLDFTSPESIEYFSGKLKEFNDIDYRVGNKIISARLQKRKTLINFPIPRHELFPIKKYNIPHAKRWPLTRVMTNIGCPYSCRFCISSQVNFRLRDVDNAIEELKCLASLGIKEVDFTDQTFTAVRAHTLDLCQKIIKEKIGITWICRTRVDVLDRKLLELMKKAGCHAINLGVESSNEEIIILYTKRIRKDQVEKAFKMCHELGITTLAYFIIGLPGETKKTARETIVFAKKLDPDYASFTVATPDYGTPLREEAIKKGWVTKKELEFDSTLSPVISTPELSAEQAFVLRREAVREFYLRPSYVFKKILEVRSLRQAKLLVQNGLSLLQKS